MSGYRHTKVLGHHCPHLRGEKRRKDGSHVSSPRPPRAQARRASRLSPAHCRIVGGLGQGTGSCIPLVPIRLAASRAAIARFLHEQTSCSRLTFANSEPVGPITDFWRSQPRRHRLVCHLFRLDAYRHLRDQSSKIRRPVSLTSHVRGKTGFHLLSHDHLSHVLAETTIMRLQLTSAGNLHRTFFC